MWNEIRKEGPAGHLLVHPSSHAKNNGPQKQFLLHSPFSLGAAHQVHIANMDVVISCWLLLCAIVVIHDAIDNLVAEIKTMSFATMNDFSSTACFNFLHVKEKVKDVQ